MNKKKWIMTIVIATAIAVPGSAIAANAVSSSIDKEKAKAIALKEVPGTITDIELERENGVVFYEVEMTKKGSFEEVDVYVAADSGAVLYTKTDDDDERDATNSSVAPNTKAAGGSQNAITKEQAGKLALTAVKGEVLKVKSDWDDGIQQYEVKIKTSNGIAEVDLAAAGGSILSIDYDDNDDDKDDDNDND
ncbi:hypothetical protein BK133_22140 [Paenibacillus sp. FSL H8-0548]|uniref:PepSY domain-containing protein n=1 Tax=Paenibacillus sp. FSL H8-0548 TaxID=1920422 RepID=UPI00096E449E|nr:PepSY domain-containing protein [Paenibacillus sp. FSL H8-0548]OMF24976.1 hypothetical protein BK133_22140 [Paenibacillus sp. FSL H8-0548]